MIRPDTGRSTGRALLEELHLLRTAFAPRANRRKVHLLQRLSRQLQVDWRSVERLHDEFLFQAAFPGSARIAAAARRALGTIHQHTARLSSAQRKRLADSGIAGTTTENAFPFQAARWLVRHRQDADLVIPTEKVARRLDPLVRLTMFPAEWDAFDGGTISSLEWLKVASEKSGRVLPWLVGAAESPTDAQQAVAYEDAEPVIRWSLHNSPFTTSLNRVATGRVRVRSGFRKLPADPVPFIARPLRTARRLSGNEARCWLDASIAAIAARCREVTPTMDPNPHEVYLADLGEGARLCVIGAHPRQRLALEANYGYVMYSNGIPIGYGGVTPLADQANTGVNIFGAFRGSEAAFLFAQSLRVFRALFGVSRFVVSPYQFGAGNDEAVASGAFWFYDRLGFRAVKPAVRRLADRERERLRQQPGARSSTATLKRLARSDLTLELAPSPVAFFDEAGLTTIGEVIARKFSTVPAAQRLERLLAAPPVPMHTPARRLSLAERRGLTLLGPVLDLIARGVHRWPPTERASLRALVAAKGGARERSFAQGSRRHARLWAALAAECRRATRRRGT